MEFWLNDIFHVLLQYAGIAEVMLNAHNDLNFVHYPNCLYISTTFFKYSLLQFSDCKDMKGFLLCPQGL